MVIQDMVLATPPWFIYTMDDDDSSFALYAVYSYNENGTVTVTRFTDAMGYPLPMWNVFGVNPKSLTRVEMSSRLGDGPGDGGGRSVFPRVR